MAGKLMSGLTGIYNSITGATGRRIAKAQQRTIREQQVAEAAHAYKDTVLSSQLANASPTRANRIHDALIDNMTDKVIGTNVRKQRLATLERLQQQAAANASRHRTIAAVTLPTVGLATGAGVYATQPAEDE